MSTLTKHTILFLAANPLGTEPRALDQEANSIHRELKLSGYRDRFEFVTRWAAEPHDLLRELRALKPTVVHISGHGGQDGLIFRAQNGKAQAVSPSAIAETFGAAGGSVRLVVLSACYSEASTEALLAHVDCVVGISGVLHDEMARAFAIGFYGALGDQESVAAAYRHGNAAISLEGLADGDRPQLKVHNGIDAEQLVLLAGMGQTARKRAQRMTSRFPAVPIRPASQSKGSLPSSAGSLPSTPPVHTPLPRTRPPRVPLPNASLSLESERPARVDALLRELHGSLLAGYPADAVICAAAIAEIAVAALIGMRANDSLELGVLIDELWRRGWTKLLADACWLYKLRLATEPVVGQICAERDSDGRRAAELATRLAMAAGLIAAPHAAACEASAAWRASQPTSTALLRLDRATHRKVLDDLLALPPRLLVMLVHGEVDQGHDHFAAIMSWRLRSTTTRWREIAVAWPPPSPSLGHRLAMLLDELAYGLGVKLTPPAGDPATPAGARAWATSLAPIAAALTASREGVLLRHVLRCLRSGLGGDDALVDAYLRAIWGATEARASERVVVGFDLRRIEHTGLPLTRGWRIAREELAATRAIERVLDRHHVAHGGPCITLPELTSVPFGDLVDWLRTERGRTRDAAHTEASQLVSSTRGGRFDLVVQRLAALHLDRQ